MTFSIEQRLKLGGRAIRGRLMVSQDCIAKRGDLAEEFDLVFACASWEPRSTAIAEARSVRAKRGILVSYKDKGDTDSAVRHEKVVFDWLTQISGDVVKEVVLDSLSPSEGTRYLREEAQKQFEAIGHRVKVLIDISSLSRYSFLSLIGYLLHMGIAESIAVHYAEAEYELGQASEYMLDLTEDLDELESDVALRRVQQVSFSKYNYSQGEWATVVVPFMEGIVGLGGIRRIYASLGFDGGPSYEVVSRHDPDEVVPILANPGYTQHYTDLAVRENAKLMASFVIEKGQVVEAFAASARDVFERVVDAENSAAEGRDVLFFCFGSKPHALALGLAASALGHPSVVCRVPHRYLERHTKASDTSWIFRIKDTSIPASSVAKL